MSRPVPNFLTANPPMGEWGKVNAILARYFRLRPDAPKEDAHAREMFDESLERLHRANVRGENITALARVVAKCVRADFIERAANERKKLRMFFAEQKSGNGRRSTSGRLLDVAANRPEKLLAELVDETRDTAPLTATFDRDELWTETQDLARRRWHERYTAPPLATPDDRLPFVHVDGKRLDPAEGACLWILSRWPLPESLEPTTKTTARELYDRIHERVKKSFIRIRRKRDSVTISIKRTSVPGTEAA